VSAVISIVTEEELEKQYNYDISIAYSLAQRYGSKVIIFGRAHLDKSNALFIFDILSNANGRRWKNGEEDCKIGVEARLVVQSDSPNAIPLQSQLIMKNKW